MDEFVTLSQAFFPSVKVGDPTAADTVCGPLISERHRSRVEGYVQRAVASGARIVAGGGRPDIPHGWYMNPTLIAGVNNSDEICREELFGPVGLVLPYRDVDDAIAICNDSHLGHRSRHLWTHRTGKKPSPIDCGWARFTLMAGALLAWRHRWVVSNRAA